MLPARQMRLLPIGRGLGSWVLRPGTVGGIGGPTNLASSHFSLGRYLLKKLALRLGALNGNERQPKDDGRNSGIIIRGNKRRGENVKPNRRANRGSGTPNKDVRSNDNEPNKNG